MQGPPPHAGPLRDGPAQIPGLQDIVVHPRPGRSTTQMIVALGCGLIFLGLAAGILYAVITDGQWPFLLALPIVALAMVGLFIDQSKNQRRARSVRPGVPVLVVNEHGIGDGFLQVPWNLVRSVHMQVESSRRRGVWNAGKALANVLAEATGVLDGTFILRVEAAQAPPPHLVHRGAHRVDGRYVEFDLGTAVPTAHWAALSTAIANHAASRGVPVEAHGGLAPR